jgi:hypothetical protein
MKQLILTIILSLLVISFVDAELTQKYHLADFSVEPVQTFTLFEKDSIDLSLVNGTHVIQVAKIHEDGIIELDIFPYEGHAVYTKIKNGVSTELDFDRNKNTDLKVELINYNYAQKTVSLKFTKLSETNQESINETIENTEKVTNSQSTPKSTIGIIVIAGIILIGLLINYLFKKRK